jgi:hypothetical protein
VPAHWPDVYSADLPQASGRGAHARFGRCAPLLDSACSLMACDLGSCCVHWHSESFGSRADRSPHEGASCATMSSHTCYRTSRSLHFPLAFGAVCSLSNPTEVFPRSVTPTRRKGHPLVVCCFLSIQRPSGVNEGEATQARTPGPPTWPGPLGPQRPKRNHTQPAVQVGGCPNVGNSGCRVPLAYPPGPDNTVTRARAALIQLRSHSDSRGVASRGRRGPRRESGSPSLGAS